MDTKVTTVGRVRLEGLRDLAEEGLLGQVEVEFLRMVVDSLGMEAGVHHHRHHRHHPVNLDHQAEMEMIEDARKIRVKAQGLGHLQYSNLTNEKLEKAIRSHRKKILRHQSYLESPESHVPNWNELSEMRQQKYIYHWQQDIERHIAYSKVANQIIKERLKEEISYEPR